MPTLALAFPYTQGQRDTPVTTSTDSSSVSLPPSRFPLHIPVRLRGSVCREGVPSETCSLPGTFSPGRRKRRRLQCVQFSFRQYFWPASHVGTIVLVLFEAKDGYGRDQRVKVALVLPTRIGANHCICGELSCA